jgi:hypothetical protein
VALRLALPLLLAVLATSAHARAQDEAVPPDALPEEEPLPSEVSEEGDALAGPQLEPIAVLLLPSGDVDAATADALGELLIAAVAGRGGAHIIGKEEFQAQLGQGDATTAECIESITCLGRVGVALGVREVIAGTLGRHGDSWAFSLNRIDLRTGAVLGRVFREVEGDVAEVVRALPQSLDDLYVETIEPGRLVVRASVEDAEVSLDGVVIGTTGEAPVRRDLVAPGPHVVVVLARGFTRYERSIDVEAGTTFALDAELRPAPTRAFELPWPTWVFGGLAIVAVVAAIPTGLSSQSPPSDDLLVNHQRDAQAFFDARTNEAITADVLYGVTVVATALAVVPAVLSAAAGEPAPPVSVALGASPSSVLVTVGGAL